MQTPANQDHRTSTSRIAAVDIARGGALVAMTIYHFSWDLSFFGWVARDLISHPLWVSFARAIAASFLFIVGFSLVLGHGEGVRWPSFWKRWVAIAGCAALITVATYFAIPDTYIFFGILHAIALFSIIGVLLMRLPGWVHFLLALTILAGAHFLKSEFFDLPALYWLGLMETIPDSNDLVPVFPWLAATLLGIAAAKFLNSDGYAKLRNMGNSGSRSDRTLGLIGRHSLLFYMLHQPVLIALVGAFTTLSGGPDRTGEFLSGC